MDSFTTSAKKNQNKSNIQRPTKSENEDGGLDIHENKTKGKENQRSNTNAKLQNLRPRITTDYQKRHDKLCKNSWQKGYTKLHHDLLESGKNRYLIYTCSGGGWGNRIREIISLFHFAVITKRAFILICNRPSPLDELLQSPHIKWNYKVNTTGLSIRKKHTIPISTIKDQADLSILNKLLNYSVEHNPKFAGNSLQFIAKNLKYDLPVWPNLEQMMGCSFYYLFKKSGALQKRIDQWKEVLGFNENIVLGIHIREGDTVFKRSNQHDKRLNITGIDFGFDCAAQIEKSIQTKYNNTNNIIWFLAADSEKVKSYATQKFGDKIKCVTGPIEHIARPSKDTGEAVHLTMFLDYFLLQEADYRLYAAPSTFDQAVNFITFGNTHAGYSYGRNRVRDCRIPKALNKHR